MLAKPGFLQVPTLYEESLATISWENREGASYYELDIIFNEDFASAQIGKSWSNLIGKDWSWENQTEPKRLSWEEISGLTAQGLMWRSIAFKSMCWDDIHTTWQNIEEHPVEFTIHQGEGERVPALDQGLTWSDFQREALGKWSDKPDKSWQEFSEITSVGLLWQQHNRKGLSWEEAETTHESWRFFESLEPYGLFWKSLNGYCFPWETIHSLGEQQEGLSWDTLEQLPSDNKIHKGHTLEIPLYSKRSMFRVRGFDAQGNATSYLTTGLIKHNPRSLKRYAPPCLHIPELHEGREAEFVWGDLYGASNYVLERKFREEFEPCYKGPGYSISHPKECTLPRELYYETDCKKHLACTDTVPYYQKNVTYRLKAYNSTDESKYLESLSIPIIPVFYREDNISFSVVQGKTYYIQLCAQRISAFEDIWMSLKYPEEKIALEKMVHTSVLGNSVHTPGEISFQCKKDIPETREWSGLVLVITVKAMTTGKVQVTLE